MSLLKNVRMEMIIDADTIKKLLVEAIETQTGMIVSKVTFSVSAGYDDGPQGYSDPALTKATFIVVPKVSAG